MIVSGKDKLKEYIRRIERCLDCFSTVLEKDKLTRESANSFCLDIEKEKNNIKQLLKFINIYDK